MYLSRIAIAFIVSWSLCIKVNVFLCSKIQLFKELLNVELSVNF